MPFLAVRRRTLVPFIHVGRWVYNTVCIYYYVIITNARELGCFFLFKNCYFGNRSINVRPTFYRDVPTYRRPPRCASELVFFRSFGIFSVLINVKMFTNIVVGRQLKKTWHKKCQSPNTCIFHIFWSAFVALKHRNLIVQCTVYTRGHPRLIFIEDHFRNSGNFWEPF